MGLKKMKKKKTGDKIKSLVKNVKSKQNNEN